MTNRARRPKTVMYKRADFNHPGLTLQQLLDDALGVLNKPALRRQNVGESEEAPVRRVIGRTQEITPMVFGTMLYYEPGRDITFVIEDENAEEFLIQHESPQQDPDQANGARREVLQSALYFGVHGNHVVVCQSQALKARDLEKHLNWLLGQELDLLPSGVGLSLSDEPTQQARDMVEGLKVRSVEFGTPITSQPEDSASDGVSSVQRHLLSGAAVEALKNLVNDGFLDRLRFDDALDHANLEVTVQVKYRRTTTESGHRALDNIARAMRHAEPEDTRITTTAGTVIQGDDLRVTTKIYVDTYNGVVDSGDMYTEMLAWFQRIMREGIVR